MKTCSCSLLVSAVMVLFGCGSAHEGARVPEVTRSQPVETTLQRPHPSICPAVLPSMMSFQVKGENLSAMNGRKARVVAFAREGGEAQRMVDVDVVIQNGSFQVHCGPSMEETGYPSWAVLIERDGNDGCSADDLGYVVPRDVYRSRPGGTLSGDALSVVKTLPTLDGIKETSGFCAAFPR